MNRLHQQPRLPFRFLELLLQQRSLLRRQPRLAPSSTSIPTTATSTTGRTGRRILPGRVRDHARLERVLDHGRLLLDLTGRVDLRKVLLQQLGRDATVRTERGGRRNRRLLLLRRHRVRRRLSGQERWKTRVLLLLLLDRLLLLRYRNGLRPLLCLRLRLRLLVIPNLLREITKLLRSLICEKRSVYLRNDPGADNVRAARTATTVRPPPC